VDETLVFWVRYTALAARGRARAVKRDCKKPKFLGFFKPKKPEKSKF